MRWFEVDHAARMAQRGEKTGRCPGCGREVEKFMSFILPGVKEVGVACQDCLDGETIERLDPHLNATLVREFLKGRSGEPPPIVNRAMRRKDYRR